MQPKRVPDFQIREVSMVQSRGASPDMQVLLIWLQHRFQLSLDLQLLLEVALMILCSVLLVATTPRFTVASWCSIQVLGRILVGLATYD